MVLIDPQHVVLDCSYKREIIAELAMICWPLGRAGHDDLKPIRDRLA